MPGGLFHFRQPGGSSAPGRTIAVREPLLHADKPAGNSYELSARKVPVLTEPRFTGRSTK